MRMTSSDPDIETIFNRIRKKQWNLQPDFQRGEVWSDLKKARLIDTVLRGWHVPPIHLVQIADTKEEVVLDGQQRLVAIRDFMSGIFCVNGQFSPIDSEVQQLNGLKYENLPGHAKRSFDRQTIRVLTILEYEPDEPGELFFRLNQPTGLTTAEQRNALFGPVRTQIKALVHYANEVGLNEAAIGFSNSRMAYDDVLGRLATTVKQGNLWEKVSAGSVADLYRGKIPLESSIAQRIKRELGTLAAINNYTASSNKPQKLKLNKATLFSYLLFLMEAEVSSEMKCIATTADFISSLEEQREFAKKLGGDIASTGDFFEIDRSGTLLEIYNDRASARVADVASVVLRDAITWILASGVIHDSELGDKYRMRSSLAFTAFTEAIKVKSSSPFEMAFLESLRTHKWGFDL